MLSAQLTAARTKSVMWQTLIMFLNQHISGYFCVDNIESIDQGSSSTATNSYSWK